MAAPIGGRCARGFTAYAYDKFDYAYEYFVAYEDLLLGWSGWPLATQFSLAAAESPSESVEITWHSRLSTWAVSHAVL